MFLTRDKREWGKWGEEKENLNIKNSVSRNISFFIMKFGISFKTNFKYFNRCLEEDFVVLVVDSHSVVWVKKKVHKVKEKLIINPCMNL